jgi:hypothetical protein
MHLFGYIRPQKPELRVREYEAYRAVYCSICRVLGRHYGIFSRLILSYDSTFYALLLLALQKKYVPCFAGGRCAANPLKKCMYCTNAQPSLKQAAALSILLSVQKLQDDRRDRGRWPRCRAFFLLPFLHGAHKKAAADFPWMEQAVCTCMRQQAEAEAEPDSTLDDCAQPTAEMLSAILAHEGGTDTEPLYLRVLQETGFYLGRWVYLMDAADDVEKDAADGDFNWFVRHYQVTKDSSPEKLTEVHTFANAAMNLTMSRLCAAFNLLDLNSFASVLRNIIELGLPNMQKQLLFKKETK